ncbi:Carb anhydrase domain containing protein [Asbolus verrucosus]|uniref:Carbonic anhydrase n=1 Tax=Asbolus verrucosus TaxID=1661398 RepID=A0A482WCP8_ASBVE|nr:Carb anhydrase domain containing protein [Asbolus verrucosus]
MNATSATCLMIVVSLCHSDEWPLECKEGKKQSPIALSQDIAQEQEFSALIFENYNYTYPVQSKNNGHSAEIRLHVQVQPSVKGGGLPHVYSLDHLHFHWGSEHTIDNYRFPLEMHLVHYAREYGNLTNALRYNGGVAVFSVLFDLSPDNDKIFEPLVDVIEKINGQVNVIQQMTFTIEDYLPRDTAGFYRYNGSLTTPDCTEGLIWTVFTNTLPISKSQVASFPTLKTQENERLEKNYRSLQPLNGRNVHIKVSPIRHSAVVTSHWTYDDQDKWPTLCKEGKKQSPISLARDEAKEEKFEPFIFDKYNKRYAVESKNNGHTVEFRISNASDNLPTVKGGGLSDAYKVDNLHFHWNSEHVIDDYRFPLELHIVHYAIKYKNIATALNYPGGVAVFAVLFDLSPDDDETFEPLVDVVDKLQQKGNVIQHPSLIIEDYLPRDTAGYFRYEGSLTTPGCTEGVIWTVFTNTLPVSKEQVF